MSPIRCASFPFPRSYNSILRFTAPSPARLSSSTATSAASASTVASRFLAKCQSIGPQTRTQLLDANQLQLFSLTLNRNNLYSNTPALSNAAPPPVGTPVPPGYHLIYFTPTFLESELGVDGTDVSYNPDAPFTRRIRQKPPPPPKTVFPNPPEYTPQNLRSTPEAYSECLP
ncbi:hypothetical protein CISG_02267 [Coccidioides immitis RMSCC 3703]|uniref:Uncharacterized protein n=1 Tax=Coccidioides immitis RMSCC 3703 TaxID=454286 RepID=A0A0J8R6F2_COCIT|nr:hypothetical protein CISG_02267 [Coccidioides immitis RMSCC 3703]